MTKYLETINPLIKEYYDMLSEDFPEFLLDYIETPRMQKQDGISCSRGLYYSKIYNIELWYSSLEHSIAVALVIWHFTHDKKQTLSGLFHDISKPSFNHCIDFMNGDYEKQESTEELTKTMIAESKEIMSLLKRDNIDIEEVCDYHIYPIADNDTPMLSADRLEYTLSNGLGQIKKIWDLNEIKKIYSDISIIEKEDNEPEMCFNTLEIAERFVEVMSELSILYMDDKARFGMEFIAEIMKRMSKLGLIKVSDLYELSEKEIIEKIKNCKEENISNCFKIWQEADSVKVSEEKPKDYYSVNVKGKKRYINPLVKTEDGIKRISEISTKAEECINKCLNYSFDRYVYMDFNFTDKEKVLTKK